MMQRHREIKAHKRPPLDFASDAKREISSSTEIKMSARPISLHTYASEYIDPVPGTAKVSDYNLKNGDIDRPVESLRDDDPSLVTPEKVGPVKFSPFRFRVWSIKPLMVDTAITDMQAEMDKQIPKGRYLFTYNFAGNADGEILEFPTGFQFEVNGKMQIMEKAKIDFVAGRAQIQINVTENLVWLLAVGAAAATALGYVMGETSDTLAQVDRILVDSWIPVAAIGGAMALYFIWKRKSG